MHSEEKQFSVLFLLFTALLIGVVIAVPSLLLRLIIPGTRLGLLIPFPFPLPLQFSALLSFAFLLAFLTLALPLSLALEVRTALLPLYQYRTATCCPFLPA